MGLETQIQTKVRNALLDKLGMPSDDRAEEALDVMSKTAALFILEELNEAKAILADQLQKMVDESIVQYVIIDSSNPKHFLNPNWERKMVPLVLDQPTFYQDYRRAETESKRAGIAQNKEFSVVVYRLIRESNLNKLLSDEASKII